MTAPEDDLSRDEPDEQDPSVDDLDSMSTLDSAIHQRPEPDPEPAVDDDDFSTMARGPEDPFDDVEALPAGAPTEIAGFVLKGIIGTGGMGSVYLAMQQRPRRPVAIKVMKAGIASPMALRRFEFEAQMLARVTHPAIAQIYEAGTWDDGVSEIPYFAMEYVPNHRLLDDYCQQHNLTSREIVRLFSPVCRGIGTGHAKGVIHRDLKPANVLVSTDGRPKIIDFGVARSTDSDQRVTMQTDVHAIVGTLQYMAPEQCAGDVLDLDTSADVYAMGVMLYELLTGQLPYEVSGPIASAIKIVTESKPERMTAINRTISEDLTVIVEKAMAKDRSDRYRTGSELADDLDRWLADEPIVARPPTLMTSVKRLVRRNKPLVAAFVGMAALIVIAVTSGVLALVNRNLALESQNSLLEAQSQKRAMVGDLISFFMRDTFDAIVPLANSQQARESVVNISLEYLSRLREQAGDDPTLQRMLAEGLQQAGINQWSLRSGNRGDIDDAIAKWEESIEIADRIHAADRTDIKSLALSIRGRSLLVDAYRRIGDDTQRDERLTQAERLSRMLPEPTGDVDQGRLVMGVLLDRSRMVPAEGNPEEDPTFSRMLEVVETLTEAFENDRRVQRDATIVWNRLAFAWSQRGEHTRSREWYERSLESRMAMLDGHEDTNTARRDIVTVHRLIAGEDLALGAHDAAVGRYRDEVLPLMRELVLDSPDDIRARDDLAKGLLEYGKCLVFVGRAAQAAPSLAEARIGWAQAAERAGGDGRSDLKNTRHLLDTELHLARAYLAAGDPAAARSAVQRAFEVLASALASWPDSDLLKQFNAQAKELRARCLEALGSLKQ